MVLLTEYGREVVWVVTGILLFVFGGSIGRKTAVVMAIAMLVLIPLGSIAKDVVGRHRPVVPSNEFLMASDNDFSFPSGHAVIVSAGAAVLLVLYRDSYKKLAFSLGLTAEAALVCYSRIYVGGHFPLDVLGGIFLGVGVAFIFIAINKRIDQILHRLAKTLTR
jgi:membrane-associated phospholipid phosphatase